MDYSNRRIQCSVWPAPNSRLAIVVDAHFDSCTHTHTHTIHQYIKCSRVESRTINMLSSKGNKHPFDLKWFNNLYFRNCRSKKCHKRWSQMKNDVDLFSIFFFCSSPAIAEAFFFLHSFVFAWTATHFCKWWIFIVCEQVLHTHTHTAQSAQMFNVCSEIITATINFIHASATLTEY